MHFIYIPIWIDLKVFANYLNVKASAIYIPIWIDLKVFSDILGAFSTIIYIPIWIDLKVQFSAAVAVKVSDLHSNMDRFERCCRMFSTLQQVDLHSNMDRFESE